MEYQQYNKVIKLFYWSYIEGPYQRIDNQDKFYQLK
jgi:hypothetical protein